MSKYLSAQSQDEKAVKAGQAVLAEANAKAQVEKKISDLNAQGVTLNAAYEAALVSPSFNIEKVFSLKAEKEANASNLSTAKNLLTELF